MSRSSQTESAPRAVEMAIGDRDRIASLLAEARTLASRAPPPPPRAEYLEEVDAALRAWAPGALNETSQVSILGGRLTAAVCVFAASGRKDLRGVVETLLEACAAALGVEAAFLDVHDQAEPSADAPAKGPPTEPVPEPHPLIAAFLDAGADKTAVARLAKVLTPHR